MELTPIEKRIIEIIRDELRPFETVKITKDKSGDPDTYLILRSEKIIISPRGNTYVKE